MGNKRHGHLKDMAHIVKLDGTNHFDWKYEFLGILEQHGLKNLIEPTAGGDILAGPNVVNFFFLLLSYACTYTVATANFTLKCIVTY
jgi:hypothetical protein